MALCNCCEFSLLKVNLDTSNEVNISDPPFQTSVFGQHVCENSLTAKGVSLFFSTLKLCSLSYSS